MIGRVFCAYIHTHTHIYENMCVKQLSSWAVKHQLQERPTCYLYIRVIVKKTKREKVSHMELFLKSEDKLIYLCSLFQ